MKVTIDNEEIEIDDDLANLIVEMNKMGLKTLSCCSGHQKTDSYISISMDNFYDMSISQYEGKFKVTIWWKYKEGLKPNHQETPHAESSVTGKRFKE